MYKYSKMETCRKLAGCRNESVSTLACQEDSRTNRYIICSAEDNLLKGAGGQAVQSMNMCNGYEEGCGLS